ncbi:MAG TPA: ABC transporter permease [Aggregatilineales bacterium]|nr:ABC transporter permease [Aggregatilineales bacterium]
MHSETRVTAQEEGVRAPWSVRFGALAALIFLHFPIALIFVYAFTTESRTYEFPPPGLTLDWFAEIFRRPDFWQALGFSLEIAGAAMVVAIVFGTLIASALYRSSFFGKETISVLVVLPIALPGIVTGIALRSGIRLLGIDFSFWTVIVGHATFCIVTVYNNVVARLRRTAYTQIEASMDLGATTLQTVRYVTLPNIATALLAGAMLAFALSFDEVIVTTFTAGPQIATLPIWMLNQLTRLRDHPVTNVAAIIVIAITFLPILIAHRYTQTAGES